MADKAALFKTGMKQLCARRGLSVTFMAKWNAELPGSSGHLHQSLWSADQRDELVLRRERAARAEQLARHYLGGQIELDA